MNTTAHYTEKDITFPVHFAEGTLQLKGKVFTPTHVPSAGQSLPPIVFNSGFTGGVSMYGQLMGKALSKRGYTVMTYDVAGFFTNKAIRNTREQNGKVITRVSLEDQKQELLDAIEWVESNLGATPAVASWAMGATVSLAVVIERQRQGKTSLPLFIPMNYTNMSNLQQLRGDAATAKQAIDALDDNAPIPPFDTGTEATKLGYYPLDKETQAYVERQLGGYTDEGGVDHWPGCTYMAASSYKDSVAFDPEAELAKVSSDLPPALIIHGADNTLHMPQESLRLHSAYKGDKGSAPLLVAELQHGQQLEAGNPVFEAMMDAIDNRLRDVVGVAA